MQSGVSLIGVGTFVVSMCALGLACTSLSESPSRELNAAFEDAGGPILQPTPSVALCTDNRPTFAYPPEARAIALGETLPNLSFEGEHGNVALKEYFEPCAPRSRLLVIRTSALWCGTCGWHAAHTNAWLGDVALAERITLLDLVVADEDNLPATMPALLRFRKTLSAVGKLAIDPSFTFASVSAAHVPLPAYVIVDTKTMRVITTDTNPSAEALRAKLGIALAQLDGHARPDFPEAKTTDGFTANELDLIRDMGLPGAPPADPTNAYADVPAAAALGKKLFFDAALSPSGRISCATCHDARKGLSDGLPQSEGIATTDRNSPGIALASHARWQFWDGRADTLWMQALGPFENTKEFASSRLFVAHEIQRRYATEYSAVFARYPMPDMSDAARFPPSGTPGSPSWDAMRAEDRAAVTRVFVDVGKAIAAFERTFRATPNALDKYAGGDHSAFTPEQKRGLKVFLTTGCVQCHHGPRLTDDAFHVLRFPTGARGGIADLGRAAGVPLLLASEFTAGKEWSDAPASARSFLGMELPVQTTVGAFKTPTLRALPASGPYGHGGTFFTLADVTKHYGGRGLRENDTRAVGATEAWVPEFDANAARELVPFLETLTGEVED